MEVMARVDEILSSLPDSDIFIEGTEFPEFYTITIIPPTKKVRLRKAS